MGKINCYSVKRNAYDDKIWEVVECSGYVMDSFTRCGGVSAFRLAQKTAKEYNEIPEQDCKNH